MKRVTRNSVFAVAAASGAMAMALPMSNALAADGSSAEGVAAGSPGVASGNAIQIPVSAPVSICGNTVNVVGLLNPAAGNSCANKGGAKAAGSQDSTASEDSTTAEEGASTDSAASSVSGGASAQGLVTDSPGLISGNSIQLPIDLPVNVSGNSVNVVGLGNPVFGNSSANGPGEPTQPPKTSTPSIPAPSTPAKPETPKSPALVPAQPGPLVEVPQLAHTGADLAAPAVAGTAALLLTGTILFRRFRPGQAR